MFIPPPPTHFLDLYSERRIRQLERALELSLSAIELLAKRLADKFGSGFLGDDLAPFTGAASLAEFQAQAAEIDKLIAEGQEAQAIRVLRDVFNITWDETQSALRSWKRSQPEDRIRSLRFAHYVKSAEGKSTQTPS